MDYSSHISSFNYPEIESPSKRQIMNAGYINLQALEINPALIPHIHLCHGNLIFLRLRSIINQAPSYLILDQCSWNRLRYHLNRSIRPVSKAILVRESFAWKLLRETFMQMGFTSGFKHPLGRLVFKGIHFRDSPHWGPPPSLRSLKTPSAESGGCLDLRFPRSNLPVYIKLNALWN